MSSRRLNEYRYYESGSEARKLEYIDDRKKRINKNNNTLSRKNAKKRTSSIVSILIVFSMSLVLVYRYNVINEKNLKSQSLSDDLSKAESSLLASQIAVEQNTDLNQIEAYAKQKLGMQKPDKNQTIYVDTSKDSSTVEINNDTNFFEKIKNSITNFLSKIF